MGYIDNELSTHDHYSFGHLRGSVLLSKSNCKHFAGVKSSRYNNFSLYRECYFSPFPKTPCSCQNCNVK